ncbi:MAG: hypothetical protein K2O15_07300 [Lachnospiraceae bacterium]|nr:hypothetical protein [Lachnospiraceae bacterium]
MKKYFFKKSGYRIRRYENVKEKSIAFCKKRYPFVNCHLESINDRPYAQEVVLSVQKYIDNNAIHRIIEVGCGLGDVIGNMKTQDISIHTKADICWAVDTIV